LTALVSLEAMALRAVNLPIGSSLMCLARNAGSESDGFSRR